MKRVVISFVLGVVAGAVLLAVVGYNGAADMMIMEDVSSLGFDETVKQVEESAKTAGWMVPAVHTISKSVAKKGYDVRPVTVVELCSPELAGRILDGSDDRRVTPMMPCRIAVYENESGEVVVARMNSGLMSRIFGATVSEIMGVAAAENEEILQPVIAR